MNYWTWTPTIGNDLPGSEALVATITPTYLRVGGLRQRAARRDGHYARAIGAEPILQVPHLAAAATGAPATAANAAAMVTYANVTKGYGIKYFSIGNEPDLYDSAGLPSDSTKPAIPGYTTGQYCASVTAYVAAMKAVDPTIEIMGPDLASAGKDEARACSVMFRRQIEDFEVLDEIIPLLLFPRRTPVGSREPGRSVSEELLDGLEVLHGSSS